MITIENIPHKDTEYTVVRIPGSVVRLSNGTKILMPGDGDDAVIFPFETKEEIDTMIECFSQARDKMSEIKRSELQ